MNALLTPTHSPTRSPLPAPELGHASIAITAQGLSKVFQTGNEPYEVLKDVDLDVPQGKLQLLMGPSGVGKTTLLYLLAGILTPTTGKVCLLGQPMSHLTRHETAAFRLGHIGFIFQELNLFSALTALENVELALWLKGVEEQEARKESIALLNQVNLGHRLDILPRRLSGGEKQRVAIARALAGNPPLIFADEPTSALDSHNGRQVMNLLQQMTRQHHCTVLMATHDSRAIEFADRVVALEDGRLT